MSAEQLRNLGNVCEEESFAADARLFQPGDPGGALYVLARGQVGIDKEQRKGTFTRLATLEPYDYFGEEDIFTENPRNTVAVAIEDSLVLCLRRDPLIALIRRDSDFSLDMIKGLSTRLTEANRRISNLTRIRPREVLRPYARLG